MKSRTSAKKKRDTPKRAAPLAPPEEADRGAVRNQAGSRENKATSKYQPPGPLMDSRGLPKGIVKDEEKESFRIDPLVLLMLGLALAYIAFIAWQIAEAPSVINVGR